MFYSQCRRQAHQVRPQCWLECFPLDLLGSCVVGHVARLGTHSLAGAADSFAQTLRVIELALFDEHACAPDAPTTEHHVQDDYYVSYPTALLVALPGAASRGASRVSFDLVVGDSLP